MLGFHPIGGGALGEGPRLLDQAEVESGYSGAKKRHRSIEDLYGRYRFYSPQELAQLREEQQGHEEGPKQPEPAQPVRVFAADAARLFPPQAIVTPRLREQISRLNASRAAQTAAREQQRQDDDRIALLLLLAA